MEASEHVFLAQSAQGQALLKGSYSWGTCWTPYKALKRTEASEHVSTRVAQGLALLQGHILRQSPLRSTSLMIPRQCLPAASMNSQHQIANSGR